MCPSNAKLPLQERPVREVDVDLNRVAYRLRVATSQVNLFVLV